MKKLDRKTLRNRLDRLAQTYARYKGATKVDGHWFNTCITCGQFLPVEKLQGGHFIPRGCIATRWEEIDISAQCCRCNGFLDGNYIAYSKYMIDTYGIDTFNQLVETRKKFNRGEIRPFTIVEMRAMYNKWLIKGRELEERTGQNLFPKTWKEEE